MTGAWQVTARSHDCDLTSVNLMDLDYLRGWSVRNDFKFLLMTVPKSSRRVWSLLGKEISEKGVSAGGAKHLDENFLSRHVSLLPDASPL